MKNKGQALIEYILIIAVISLVVVGLVKYFGGYLKDYITKSGCNLLDKEYIDGEKPGEGTCKYIEFEEKL